MTTSTRDETPSEKRPPDKNQDAVIDFLSRPEAYGGGVDRVEVLKSQLEYTLGKIDWQPIDASGGEEATLAAARVNLV